MWIHEHQNCPNFTWDDTRLTSKLANTRHRQGHLLGKMEYLGFKLRNEATLNTLTSDIIKSSAIEGETLDPQEVRSSIALRLGGRVSQRTFSASLLKQIVINNLPNKDVNKVMRTIADSYKEEWFDRGLVQGMEQALEKVCKPV